MSLHMSVTLSGSVRQKRKQKVKYTNRNLKICIEIYIQRVKENEREKDAIWERQVVKDGQIHRDKKRETSCKKKILRECFYICQSEKE